MALNRVYKDGRYLSLAVTKPDVPNSGDPVRFGALTGVALTDEDADGKTSCDLGAAVYKLSVTDTVTGGIAAGDPVFETANADAINNTATNYFYGFALEDVPDGQTKTIKVLHVPSPGAGTLADGSVSDAKLAVGAVSTTKLAADAVTSAKLADDQVDGQHCAQVANDDTTPGIPVLYAVAIAGGAAANEDIVIDEKIRVIDAWCQHTAGAGEANDTIQVKNGGDAITDAMSWAGADNTIVRAGEIDDANSVIAAAGTLRISTIDDDTGGDVGAGIAYVLGIRVA